MTSKDIPLAGVLGWPISHSLSPVLHNAWLKHLNINGYYVPLACLPEALGDVLTALPKTGFRGFNVTIPHKERVMAHLDVLTQRAQDIGAVNTIWLEEGKLHGDSTDGDGFVSALPDAAKSSSHTALVIGAGGAARSIVYALAEKKTAGHIHIANRTQARAAELAEDLQSHMGDAKLTAGGLGSLPGCDLLINTTSAGMTDMPVLDIDLEILRPGATVYDIVYTPLQTPLLRAAKARGCIAINGLSMLIEQAKPGFKHWFGKPPPTDLDAEALLVAALQQT